MFSRIGLKFYYALKGKPQNVKEAFDRVVKFAGNGKKGSLVNYSATPAREVKVPTNMPKEFSPGNAQLSSVSTSGVLTRKYSNGVELRHSTGTTSYSDCGGGWSVINFCDRGLLGVFNRNGRLVAAQLGGTSDKMLGCHIRGDRFVGTSTKPFDSNLETNASEVFNALN